MFICFSAITGLTKTTATAPVPAEEPNAQKPATQTSTMPSEVIQPQQTKTEVTSDSGLLLKDASNFPVIIIVTKRIDLLNEEGGFGVDSGDELLVLRKQDNKYIVGHQDKEYVVDPNLIDDMRVK